MTILPSLLVADDDENDIFFIQRAFKEADIQNPFYIAHDGQEAIDILSGEGKYSDRKQYPFPVLLILDLKMPRKTGMDVLNWKRDQTGVHCIPTIIFSSSAHRHDIERAYNLGANAFVVKPSSLEARLAFAKFIKGFWLDFNHPPSVCMEGLEEAVRLHQEITVPGRFL